MYEDKFRLNYFFERTPARAARKVFNSDNYCIQAINVHVFRDNQKWLGRMERWAHWVMQNVAEEAFEKENLG